MARHLRARKANTRVRKLSTLTPMDGSQPNVWYFTVLEERHTGVDIDESYGVIVACPQAFIFS